ncbi:MAG: glycosyltransferase [Leptolyngbya sp. SIO1D8]|nr:glycosyltransferase [Leptolyngbya sp. SIO1D8]
MTYPQVTIVAVPRERFQFTQESLESLYENTQHPFHLIYVDNHSPAPICDYLASQAKEKGFELVRSPQFLSPNQARNVGLRRVKTPYVVFVDNDVVFSPGWLKALVECAEETGATVVGSLVCQYKPLHTIIHCIGGDYMATRLYHSYRHKKLKNKFQIFLILIGSLFWIVCNISGESTAKSKLWMNPLVPESRVLELS